MYIVLWIQVQITEMNVTHLHVPMKVLPTGVKQLQTGKVENSLLSVPHVPKTQALLPLVWTYTLMLSDWTMLLLFKLRVQMTPLHNINLAQVMFVKILPHKLWYELNAFKDWKWWLKIKRSFVRHSNVNKPERLTTIELNSGWTSCYVF